LVRERDRVVAEMGVVAAARHGQLSFAVRTIARRAQGRYVRTERALTMPELPEVETVRRGLAPAMEGASIVEVVVRDRRLRWPIVKDFEKRLTGKKVEGLGRRAKYLLADMSS